MHQLTLGPAIVCLLILVICLFVLLAKTKVVSNVFNFIGNKIQAAWSFIKKTFKI